MIPSSHPFPGLSLVIAFLIVLHSCSAPTDQDVFVFNPAKDYPEFPLSLSDVAEVRYVKLGGEEEGIFLTTLWDWGLYIDDLRGRIFADNYQIGVMEFDINGNFIRKLGRLGNGPGEYATTFFYVQPETERVGVYNLGQNKFLMYDYDGNYHKDEGIEADIFISSSSSFQFYGDCLVAFNPNSAVFDESSGRTNITGRRTLELFSLSGKKDRTIKDMHYEKPIVRPRSWGGGGQNQMTTGYLFPSYSGMMVSTYRCDTTYVIGNDFRWRPFLVNTRHNGVQEGCLYPVAETQDYLFLCHKNNLREGQVYYFAIDKKSRQAYKITEDRSNPLPGCLQDKVQVRNEGLTKNADYRFWEFHPDELKGECYDYLPPELKTLVDQCDEGSNPIYMIIRFRSGRN